ncbi:RuvC Holliday junction resolvasome, endonuclease subunit [uncultured Caudovirales phage]|uniref:RuvC Holliday junction resolvasome, endonuclease subunit n=1 Tax=uncultured Caudovirales phage TaxID=2100421 RepID=A0A6J5NZZ9_9CAUD|nr:RuvC Holliday junction resolvasome, endonuclease subunit [uncultured Caudovirales phage]
MTPTNIYIGLDLSVTGTGFFAVAEHEGEMLATCATFGSSKLRYAERLAHLQLELMECIRQVRWTLETPSILWVGIEDYAMNAKGRITTLAEWGGVARLTLLEHRARTLSVAPSTLKAWTAGHGHSDKSQMAAAIRKRMQQLGWPANMLPAKANDNEVDACALALLVRERVRLEAGTSQESAASKKFLRVPAWECAHARETKAPGPARRR